MTSSSDLLQNLICNRIDKQGPITFAAYMHMALYEPGLGYYRSGSQKFGAGGDFTTSPEISPLFAQTIAGYAAKTLDDEKNEILEIGAGSGILACEIMRALEGLNALPKRYYILDVSGELVQRQQQLIQQSLPHLYDRFVWLTSWPKMLINGVVIANELLDAMPVHKFVMQDGIKEYYVTHEQQQLKWHIDQPTQALLDQINTYQLNFEKGYDSEINLQIKPWFKGLKESFASGKVLLIDYGYEREAYYHPERSMGTLMCHVNHRAHDDPLLHPGMQDITAHVDFTLVAEAANAVGFDVSYFGTQAQFLMEEGIADLISKETDPVKQVVNAQAVKQLIMPDQMGERFRVIELSS